MDGWLTLEGGILDEVRAINEALSAYQRSRGVFSRLILCGLGAGSAYALMLAQRFTADEVWLAPFLSPPKPLARAMRVNRGALYAVLSPIRLLMPERASLSERLTARRILTGVRSSDKRVINYAADAEALSVIQNAQKGFKIVKTLA